MGCAASEGKDASERARQFRPQMGANEKVCFRVLLTARGGFPLRLCAFARDFEKAEASERRMERGSNYRTANTNLSQRRKGAKVKTARHTGTYVV